MIRVVADLGNSRLKWGLVGPDGHLVKTVALPGDDPSCWPDVFRQWGLDGSTWAVGSVNPPVADRLRAFLHASGVKQIRWFTSAADVPVEHRLDAPEATGADRALAVLAARERLPAHHSGLVVLCGSAITVERLTSNGVWHGGAIAPGLGLSARALHLMTAQLPLIPELPEPPPDWGASTEPALAAGLFWGTVGAVREILARQRRDLPPPSCLIWTGGDAPLLASQIVWDGPSWVAPELILDGLVHAAFRHQPLALGR